MGLLVHETLNSTRDLTDSRIILHPIGQAELGPDFDSAPGTDIVATE
jgi:hypothetical protein